VTENGTRILLVIDEATVGGGQQHVLWLAEGLNRAQFEVAVACEARGYLVDELHKHEIRHYPVSMSNLPNPIAIRACLNIIHEYAPAIVHTHGGTAGVTGRLAALMVPAVRIVHTYHGIHYLHDSRMARRMIFGKTEKALGRATDRCICVSQGDFRIGSEAGIIIPERTTIVRNGIATKPYECVRTYDTTEHPVIGTIGRLHPQKGHRFLIEAARDVIGRYPGAEFQIIGDGELDGELKARTAKLGLEGNIRFLGSRTDIAALLEKMDVFVLPSLWEGLPLVLLEAMASGLPVVATAVDGVTEIARDRVETLLVKPKDVGALSHAMLMLLGSRTIAEQLGRAAKLTVVERFGVDRMVRETEDVYRSVLK